MTSNRLILSRFVSSSTFSIMFSDRHISPIIKKLYKVYVGVDVAAGEGGGSFTFLPMDIYQGNYPDWYRPHLHKKKEPNMMIDKLAAQVAWARDNHWEDTWKHLRHITGVEKIFEVEGDRYKTIEVYDPYKNNGQCSIYWNGWKTDAQTLLANKWVMTTVTNNFTKTKKLYVRDPVTKLCGSGLLKPNEVHLEYLCHEKNKRIKKFIKEIDSEQVIRITEENIPAVLEYIADLRKKTLKKKKKKRSLAEVLEFIQIAA